MRHESKQLPSTGFLRIRQVLEFIPVSRSAWWNGVKDGRYPAPVKLGPRTSAWHVGAIRELIDRLASGQGVN
ncbi:MAG: helix-turn-helix transcriptional regulator [Thermodesulfobacteriota bacterium]